MHFDRSRRVLVFASDDEFVAAMRRYANDHVTTSAFFHGLGGFQKATIAYWNAQTLKYEDIEVGEQVEVLSITGNLMRIPDGFKVHAHVVLGKRDGSTMGGHLKSGIVHPTLELLVTFTDAALHRQRDEASGLDLLVTDHS